MGPRAAPDAHFPVRKWQSYELLEYLGSGAMGSVYKAIDHRLGRHVAIKFLMGDDPRLIERFQQEARAQARVEHEHLCKVYEVGEVEGRHYIAMQFIDGERLSAAAARMTLPEKLLLMRDIAEGLHEAHRAGLVHRDIKPANIMVSRGEDGRWKPFVLDFGLARIAEAAGMTVTGAVVGTPSYMSPEQARGEVHKLDRRSDVYGLGATLYAMLTDRPPFAGQTLHEVIPQVLHDMPATPRASHPEIPADVESIVLKCLRKDPAERYDSARALADDLRRYLDGEPIQARPTSAWYRLRIRARKNRVAVAVAAVALPVVLAAIGWALWNQWTGVRQQQLAQDFGQRVQRIESIARIAAMAPLHDIRPERERIRGEMAAITESMSRLGTIARGPGRYALGRGHLALDELREAREQLQHAWDGGYRQPEVSYGLGLVLARLYADRLEDVAAIANEDERAQEREKSQMELRDPALAHLRNAALAESEASAYLEGLLAYCEERHADAVAKAREAFATHGWLHEAKRLEGEVHLALAREATARGEHEAADQLYAQSAAALGAAAAVAPSDPRVYTDRADIALARVSLQVQHLGGDIAPAFADGMAAVDTALAVQPEDGTAYGLRALLHKRMAEYLIDQGLPVGAHLDEAIAAGTRGAELSPTDATIRRTLGATYRQIGKDVRRSGGDPRPAYENAIAAYEAAGRLTTDWAFHHNLGLLHKDVATYQASIGQDPRASFENAIASYEQSIALRSSEFATHYNLAAALLFLANHERAHGTDPQPTFSRSLEAYRAALARSPDHPLVLQSLGRALNDLALHELGRGADPTAHASEALEVLTRAIEGNPASTYLAHFHEGRGVSHTTIARHRLERGEDPSAELQRAIAECETAIAANPSYSYAYANLADACAVLAEYRNEVGEDPGAAVERARRAGQAALAEEPSETYPLDAMAQATEALARYRMAVGRDPVALTDEIREYVIALAAEDSTNADAPLRLGAALAIRAEWMALHGDAAPVFEEAIRQLRRAASLNPTRSDVHAALAEAHVRRARAGLRLGREVAEDVGPGLEAVDAALRENSRLALALALRAELLLLRAESARSADAARADLAAGEAALREAIALNPLLARRLREPQARLDRLRSGSRGA